MVDSGVVLKECPPTVIDRVLSTRLPFGKAILSIEGDAPFSIVCQSTAMHGQVLKVSRTSKQKQR
jgi:hypothetical protein